MKNKLFYYVILLNFNFLINSADSKNTKKESCEIIENLNQETPFWTFLKNLIVNNQFEQFKFFIEAKPDLINYQDKMGINALMFCITHKRVQFVELLIKKGAKLDSENVFSVKTALAMSLDSKQDDIVNMLRKAGAKK